MDNRIYSVKVNCDRKCTDSLRMMKKCSISDDEDVLEMVSEGGEWLAFKFWENTFEVLITKPYQLGRIKYRIPVECLIDVNCLNGEGEQ